MISNQKELFEFVDSVLKKEKFVKKKDTWYYDTEECLSFFHLGKAAYGGNYDGIMGCFLKEINETQKNYPEYYKCHLRFALGFIAGEELVERTFNLENNEFKGTEREFIIKELLELYVMPFVKEISTKKSIIASTKKYADLIYYMNGNLRQKLSLKL